MKHRKPRQAVGGTWVKLGLLCAALIFGLNVAGGQSGEFDLAIRNDYIAIIVNGSEENTGRFALETTGGDPTRPDDDRQPLLYQQGGRGPRTSYTTFQVDGVNYVFGGPTRDRAGFQGTYGEMVQRPTIVVAEDGDETIVAAWQLGPVLVTQELGFARSSTTGLFDTAAISYTVTNPTDEPHRVGVRIVLDTMLGQNDGAPFRMGEQAIVTDTVFQQSDLPDFWQAFDSLTEPRVIGQGTFRGPGITPPDRVYLTNWGAVADGIWDFSFEPGRDFTRLGEFDLDSAMALFWDPVEIGPGESRRYVTHYGLGGISIVRGSLSLGITSPASIDAGRERSFPVIVYVQNTGEGDALDVAVRICVVPGLALPGSQMCETRRLGDLPVGREAQVRWEVFLDGAVGGTLEYTVEATAENLPDPVLVSRQIEVLGPPRLALSITGVEERVEGIYTPWDPTRHPIAVTVTNVGPSVAKDVAVSIEMPVGMALSPVDREKRRLGQLEPNESRTTVWHVSLLGYSANLPFTVYAVDEDSGAEVRQTAFLDMLFRQRGYLELTGKGSREQPAQSGDVVKVDVLAENIRLMSDLTVEVVYDAARLAFVEGPPDLLGVLRGDVFVYGENGQPVLLPFSAEYRPPGADGKGRIRITGDRSSIRPTPIATSGRVATLLFLALEPGETNIELAMFRVGAEGEPAAPDKPSQVELRGVTVHIVP